jgi:hypothetical protein
VKNDHDDRIDALKVEAIADGQVNAAKQQDAIRVEGTKTRTDGYNQAAAKRIEGGSAAGKTNGDARPASAPAERFNDDEKKVDDVAGTWIDGFRCNQVLDDIQGSTRRQVREALTRAKSDLQLENLFSHVEKPDPDRVMAVVRRRVMFAVHGTPEERCRKYGEIQRTRTAAGFVTPRSSGCV